MMRCCLIFPFLFFSPLFSGASQLSITAPDYIAMWKDEAIYQMAVHKIPASITMAQAMLESGNGNSRLATEGNNHFGIKCHEWKGKTIHDDDETRNECFRKYTDARESFEDHSLFLKKKRYEPLFLLEVDDYKGWAKGLKQCGYATNPKYPQLLIRLIEENNLHQYDEIGKKYVENEEVPRARGAKNPATPVVGNNKSKDHKRTKKNNEDFPSEITISSGREIVTSKNRIRFVVAREGDSLEKIATDMDLHAGIIRRYNDLDRGDQISPGQIIYLQPKRNKGAEDSYTVKPGDTLWKISQSTGVKLKKLRSRNDFKQGQEPTQGTVLKLR
ncbi:MAG: glucosaminidase domain-containing protein [Crocinitomicaceae bacterium]|nr:glucosaminidase domain-containing protein [Crocinitomicaceae bacterium]